MARHDGLRDPPEGRAPERGAQAYFAEQLQAVARRAAEELQTPVALISLVMDRAQFFEAHHRQTPDRVDAFAIRASLGTPIQSGGVTIGTLCVLDTTERLFTADEVLRLEELAQLVTRHSSAFESPRGQDRLRDVARPAVAESRNLLTALELQLASARLAVADLGPLVRFAWSQREKVVGALARAAQAYPELLATLNDLSEVSSRLKAQHTALEGLLSEPARTSIGNVLETATALSLHETRLVGGVEVDGGHHDHWIRTPRATAAGTLSSLLATVARSLRAEGSTTGIRLTTRGEPERIIVSIWPLPVDTSAVATTVKRSIPWDPTLQAVLCDGELELSFERETLG